MEREQKYIEPTDLHKINEYRDGPLLFFAKALLVFSAVALTFLAICAVGLLLKS